MAENEGGGAHAAADSAEAAKNPRRLKQLEKTTPCAPSALPRPKLADSLGELIDKTAEMARAKAMADKKANDVTDPHHSAKFADLFPSSTHCTTMPKKTKAKKRSTGAAVASRPRPISYLADDGGGVLLVDANNVRGSGPSPFKLPLALFVDNLAHWTKLAGYTGRVFCIVDHGQTQESFLYKGQIIVTFAGQGCTADDVICDDARGFATACDHCPPESGPPRRPRKVAVITNDRNLRKRLLRPHVNSPSAGQVRVFHSDDFLMRIDRCCTSRGLTPADSLFPLSMAECRLRSAMSEHLADDYNETENGADLSSGYFQEVTWHRVLTAELLRRELSRTAGKIVEATFSNTDHLTAADEGASKAATMSCPSDLVDRSLAAQLALRNFVDCSTSECSPDELMRSMYVAGKRRPSDPSKSLLHDHRIRHDGMQQAALRDYIVSSSPENAAEDCKDLEGALKELLK